MRLLRTLALSPKGPLTLAACALLSACSGSNSKPDAGPVDAGDPAHLFGLVLNSCYEYTDGETALPQAALGLAVEKDDAQTVQFFADGGSGTVAALKVVYRVNGADKMEDYLRVDGKSLLLLKRNALGAETVTYNPSVLLARLPFKNADHYDHTGTEREFTPSGGGGQEVPYALTFDVSEGALSVPEATANGADAFTFSYVENPTHRRLDSWSFKPGTGPAVVAGTMAGDFPDGGNASATYKLQAIRTLGAGDICGAAH